MVSVCSTPPQPASSASALSRSQLPSVTTVTGRLRRVLCTVRLMARAHSAASAVSAVSRAEALMAPLMARVTRVQHTSHERRASHKRLNVRVKSAA